MAAFWAVSVASLVISSAVVGFAAAHAPGGRTAHVVVVGCAYVGTYATLWLAKFVVYQRVLFRSPRGTPDGQEECTSAGRYASVRGCPPGAPGIGHE